MINERIADFVARLANVDLTEDEICEYLTTTTCTFLNVEHAWISEVTNRKTVRARAS